MPVRRIVPADARNVAEAARLLRAGALVVFPTETVYGVGAWARDEDAVRRIFTAKRRPPDHPLIVHLPDASHLAAWTRGSEGAALRLAEAFWPGPLTLVLPRASHVHDAVTGGQPTVAVRVPSHPVAAELLAQVGDGVAAPSANRFGRLSPTRAGHADEELGAFVAVVLDGGPCAVGVESTILDLSGERARLLRPGGITAQRIAEVSGEAPLPPDAAAPRAPGGLPSHYAPGAPARLVDAQAIADAPPDAALLLRAAAAPRHAGPTLRLPEDAEGYAHGLYAALRRLDAQSPPVIWIERPPDAPAWAAIQDRLQRACAARSEGGA